MPSYKNDFAVSQQLQRLMPAGAVDMIIRKTMGMFMSSATLLRIIDDALERHVPHIGDVGLRDSVLTFHRGLKSYVAQSDTSRYSNEIYHVGLSDRLQCRLKTLIERARNAQISDAGFLSDQDHRLRESARYF